MPFEETFSPAIHRVNQAIRHRAMYPEDKGIGKPAKILTKWENPPGDIVSKSAKKLEKLVKVAAVKQGNNNPHPKTKQYLTTRFSGREKER